MKINPPTATTNTAVCSRYGKGMRHVTHSLPAGNSASYRNTTRGDTGEHRVTGPQRDLNVKEGGWVRWDQFLSYY